MTGGRWPDGRSIAEIIAGVQAGEAEVRADGREPWGYDPGAAPGFTAGGRWQGPPTIGLLAGFLRSPLAVEALVEYLGEALWDLELTCPEALRAALLRQAATVLEEAGRVSQVLGDLADGQRSEALVSSRRGDNQHVYVSAIRLLELVDVLSGRGWDPRSGPPAPPPAPLPPDVGLADPMTGGIYRGETTCLCGHSRRRWTLPVPGQPGQWSAVCVQCGRPYLWIDARVARGASC